MTDTPLYCPCGNRLGLRRHDDAFVWRHVGRTCVLYRAFAGDAAISEIFELAITCEQCALTTDYGALLDKPLIKG